MSEPTAADDIARVERTETEPLLGNVGAASQKEDSTYWQNLILGTGILAQFGLLVLAVVIWTAIFSMPFSYLRDNLALFSAHPLLNSLGLVLLFESILILQPTYSQVQKYNGAIIHSILNGLAFLLFAGAFVVIVVNKFRHSGSHFESPHAILGLITYVGIIIQVIIGFTQFYTPNIFGSIEQAKSIYKYHRIAGYALQIVLLGTVLAATQTTFNLNELKIKPWHVAIGILLVLSGVLPRIKKEKLGIRTNSG